MNYERTYWETGDIVSADKLNNIEVGIMDTNTDLRPYPVILIPTAADFSGTMDTTPQDLKEVYQAGLRIVFLVRGFGEIYPTQFIVHDSSVSCFAFGIIPVDGVGDVLIKIATDASDTIYSTTIYPLTPMS